MSLNYKSAILFLLFLLLPVTALAQQTVLRHTVQQGETLYGLSVKYGVTAEQIVRANAGLTAENLKAGATIVIPPNGTAQPECKEMHRIKKGETLWSLSRQYGITVDQLVAANPEMAAADYKLKKGRTICIPYPAPAASVAEPVADSLFEAARCAPLEKINIALILPLTSEGAEGKRSVEYYRGFLMAVEAMKKSGKSVSVFAFDERQSDTSLDSVLGKIRDYHAHLIIGPVYPSHFEEVCNFAAAEGIKVCAPFSSKLQQIATCPQLFLMNAPDANKHAYAADLFMQSFPTAKVVFVLSGQNNEASFTRLLSEKLRSAGSETATLPSGFEPENLKDLVAPDRLTILVPTSSDRHTLTALLQKLKAFRTKYPRSLTALFGYPDWLAFKGRDSDDLFDANTYVFTHFYYNPQSPQVRAFETDYQRWFNTKMIETYPRMALLGYDEGLYMMTGLAQYGTGFTTQGIDVPLLQTHIAFEGSGTTGGGHINRSMVFIHYMPNGSIQRIYIR